MADRGLPAVRMYPGLLLVLLVGLLTPQATGTTAALASAGAVAVAVALIVHRALTARLARPVPAARVHTTVRDRERRTAFLPQRDPDAAGRPHPRAPGLPSRR